MPWLEWLYHWRLEEAPDRIGSLSDTLHYHLVGIGGAGMSAIARILHDRGEAVSGSDRQENDATRRLRSSGVHVSIGHDERNVEGADVVVYTAAVPEDNPEVAEARRRGIPLLERAAMLGRIMEPYRHRIAVSGTHGKTTTTSMISAIFDRAGLDASVLVGGDVGALNGNARLGEGAVIVAEACEAFESFLHLRPSIAVLTNIDADHLDYYGTIEHVEDSFRQFLGQVSADGCVVAFADDPRVRSVVESCDRRAVWFGLTGDPDVLARDIDVSTPRAAYTLVRRGDILGRVMLGVPGEQNIVDALAASAVAFEMDVTFESIRDGLAAFRGAGRRFEILLEGDVMVVDDYAHHPTEVAATLGSAKSAYPDRRLVAVFQPHLYSRTQAFARDFARSLSAADEVIVTAIYAAREQPIEGVSAETIVRILQESGFANAIYAPDKDTVAADLACSLRRGDLALIMGAGDIREVGERLAETLGAGPQ